MCKGSCVHVSHYFGGGDTESFGTLHEEKSGRRARIVAGDEGENRLPSRSVKDSYRKRGHRVGSPVSTQDGTLHIRLAGTLSPVP